MNIKCPIAFFVCLIVSLQLSSCIAQDADEIIEKVFDYYESTDDLLLKNAEPIHVQQLGKDTEKEIILHWDDDGFLFAADYGSALHFIICNHDYWADLHANLNSKRSDSFRIPDFKTNSFGMTDFGKAKPFEPAIRPTILTHIGATFFAANHGLEQWKSTGGTAKVLDSKSTKGWTEIKLTGWPDGDGEFVIRVNPDSGQVFGFTGFLGTVKVNCEVEEFTELNGVMVPCAVRTEATVPSHPSASSSYKTTWKYITKDDFGYDPKQLFLSYYSLPEPKMDMLPNRNGFPWLSLATTLVALCAGAAIVWHWRKE